MTQNETTEENMATDTPNSQSAHLGQDTEILGAKFDEEVVLYAFERPDGSRGTGSITRYSASPAKLSDEGMKRLAEKLEGMPVLNTSKAVVECVDEGLAV